MIPSAPAKTSHLQHRAARTASKSIYSTSDDSDSDFATPQASPELVRHVMYDIFYDNFKNIDIHRFKILFIKLYIIKFCKLFNIYTL